MAEERELLTVCVRPDVAAYVAGGFVPRETLALDLGVLGPEDRELLARHLYQAPPGVFHVSGEVRVAAPTAQAVLAALRDAEAQEAAGRAALERQRVERAAAARAEAARVLAARETRSGTKSEWLADVGTRAEWQVLSPAWPYGYSQDDLLDARDGAEARAWQAELDARNAAARDEAVVAARAERDRKQAREREFCDWAREHASERVRLLLEENHPAWLKLAVGEWLDAHTPTGYAELTALMSRYAQVVAWGERERTTPTVEDIIALRAARALVDVEPDHLRDPEMAWIATWRDATDNDDPDDVDEDGQVAAGGIPVIRLSVVAPTGASRNVYRPVEPS